MAPNPATLHRQVGRAGLILMGFAGGTLCYLLAEVSTPSAAISAEEHDRWLTQRLGFILAPALALWLGWLQRSWRRAIVGGGCGLLSGWLCLELCSGTFQPVLLALPILMGAIVATLCASRRNDWLHCLAGRFAKALLVGLVIGLVYIDLLSLGAQTFWPSAGIVDYTSAHIRMMWRAGSFALGISGAVLFPSIRWAAGLGRPRVSIRVSGSTSPPSERVRSPIAEISQAA